VDKVRNGSHFEELVEPFQMHNQACFNQLQAVSVAVLLVHGHRVHQRNVRKSKLFEGKLSYLMSKLEEK
jgi:hypothetical protein